jgi:hypothetical protein
VCCKYAIGATANQTAVIASGSKVRNNPLKFTKRHYPLAVAKKKKKERRKKNLSACRGEGSAVGLQLRARFVFHFVPAALLAMPRTALAPQCVSKARDWTSHVDR